MELGYPARAQGAEFGWRNEGTESILVPQPMQQARATMSVRLLTYPHCHPALAA